MQGDFLVLPLYPLTLKFRFKLVHLYLLGKYIIYLYLMYSKK